MRRLILIVLVLAMVLGFASCTENEPETPTNDIEETVDPELDYAPDLPSKYFPDGTTFTFGVRWNENNDEYAWNNNDIVSEGLDGDNISNAVFERNAFFEEKYNVIIAIHKCGDCGVGLYDGKMSSFIRQNAMTGDVPIDAILASPYSTVGFAIDGLITDLETLEYLDLENEWWDQGALSDLRMGDRIYMAAGDVTFVDNKAVTVYGFNKDFAEALSLPDIYKTVEDKEWTLEKLKEYSEMAYQDLNSDGPDVGDKYGFTFWQDQVYCFVTSSGLRFTELNGDGYPQMTIATPTFIDGWEKIIDTVTAPGMFNRYAYYLESGQSDDGGSVFTEGRALFSGMSVSNIMKLNSTGTEIDYGIIPSPLYDEDQDDYITTVAAYGYSMLSVPTGGDSQKLSDTGYILEAFSATSRATIQPVFYDLVLQYRVAQAQQDAKMLDLIYSKIRYDIGNFMNFDGFVNDILQLFVKQDKGIYTWYMGAETAINEDIKKFSKVFE